MIESISKMDPEDLEYIEQCIKKNITLNILSYHNLFEISVHRNYNGIDGLWYIQNYLMPSEISDIKTFIKTINLQPLGNINSRRVAHYGYYYSYDRSGLKTAPKIPSFLKKLIRINDSIRYDLIKKPFDQVIINEYKYNQQIAYHTDHIKQFGPIIACITIGESVPIYFKNGTNIKKLNIDEGSIYIMTGNARYIWKHSLKNLSQNIRYSITYRTINDNN